jgi:hypothetical protein
MLAALMREEHCGRVVDVQAGGAFRIGGADR